MSIKNCVNLHSFSVVSNSIVHFEYLSFLPGHTLTLEHLNGGVIIVIGPDVLFISI